MRKEPLLTAVPPVPVASLSELYAIAFDQARKATQRYGALATQTDERLLPVRSRIRGALRRASASAATACPRPALPPAASAPIRPICAGRRSISSPRPRSPRSGIPAWRRPTPRGRSRPATASAPSCSGPTSSRWPKIRWFGERRKTWLGKRCPTAICGVASAGWPGGPRRRRPRTARLPTSPHRRRCWKVCCSGTSIAWSQGLTPAQRDQLLAMDPSRLPPNFLTPSDQGGIEPASGTIEADQAPRAATRRTTVEHLPRRCRQRRGPKQHGARAKTGGAVHHAARGTAQYCRGIGLAAARTAARWPAAQIQIGIALSSITLRVAGGSGPNG